MNTWITSLWDSIRSSFWFVPALLSALALLMGLLLPAVDHWFHEWITTHMSWVTITPQAAQTSLSSLASAMVTVAGIVLSITVVALSITTSQYGSRLLRTFMTDWATQLAIGTFIACSLYCLIVLKDVHLARGHAFVPHLSVTVGLFSAIFSLGVLIFFVHHMAMSIQAHNVVHAVARDLNASIDRLYPEEIGVGASPEDAAEEDPPDAASRELSQLGDDFAVVRASGEGYLQAVEGETLMDITTRRDLVIEMLCRPGSFVCRDLSIARAWPASACDAELARKLNAALILGANRTPRQDVEFAISELVEVAVRALSPAINNPFTAMNCIDRLGAGAIRVAGREMPDARRRDGEDRLRVVARPLMFPQLLRSSFEQIRYYGRTNPDVILHLLEMLAMIGSHARRACDREAVREEAEAALRSSENGLPDARDRDRARASYEHVLRVLDGAEPVPRGEREGEALPPRTLT